MTSPSSKTESPSITDTEMRALLRLAETWQLLIDHHHNQEAEADAVGADECAEYSKNRREPLEKQRDKLLRERGDEPGDMHLIDARRTSTHETGAPQSDCTGKHGSQVECDVVRDQRKRIAHLERQLALHAELEKAMEESIGVEEGQTFEQRAEELGVMEVSGENIHHAFKNFHRLLCKRFGYVHDEKDWQRDQLSLIEHIAKHPETSADARDAARIADDTPRQYPHNPPDGCLDCLRVERSQVKSPGAR
jgi:hypothetical protein